MRVDESWQARVCMSVSSTLIARSNEQWELHESWRESVFFFRFPCFYSASSMVNIFFFFLFIIMGNDLDIACFWFFLSVRQTLRNIGHFVEPFIILIDSHATLITGQTSQTSHWLSSKFEPAQSWWECMRVDESWWSNESESCDSYPLSSSFDQALSDLPNCLEAIQAS